MATVYQQGYPTAILGMSLEVNRQTERLHFCHNRFSTYDFYHEYRGIRTFRWEGRQKCSDYQHFATATVQDFPHVIKGILHYFE